MWVGAAPHWLHATSLPEVDLARVHQSHFTFLIDLNTVQQCSRNSGPPTTDGPRLSAGGIWRKSISKIVSDSDRMKNTSRHVSAKTAFVDWPSTESGRISSFHNFIFFSTVPDYGLDDRATGVIVSTCSWGSVGIIYLPRCGLFANMIMNLKGGEFLDQLNVLFRFSPDSCRTRTWDRGLLNRGMWCKQKDTQIKCFILMNIVSLRFIKFCLKLQLLILCS
jgi:hypothetical protein